MSKLKNNLKFNLTDGFLKQNVIIVSGLAAFPVIAAATTLKKALVLSLAFALISFLTIAITSFIPRKIVYTIRIVFIALISAIVYIPVALLLNDIFPNITPSLGVYMPTLVVNSVILSKSESRFHLMPKNLMLIDTFVFTLGFTVATILIGTIREILAFRTIFGVSLAFIPFDIPVAEQPFFGFILIGCVSALVRAIIGKSRANKLSE